MVIIVVIGPTLSTSLQFMFIILYFSPQFFVFLLLAPSTLCRKPGDTRLTSMGPVYLQFPGKLLPAAHRSFACECIRNEKTSLNPFPGKTEVQVK